MRKIEIVAFDYNGTLADDASIGHKACNHMLRFYGQKPVSFNRFRQTFGTPWIDFYTANGVLRSQIDIPTHQAEYQRVSRQLVARELCLHKGVREILDLLRKLGIVLAVLSSRNVEDLNEELIRLGIKDNFALVIGEENVNLDGVRAGKRTDRLIEGLGITNNADVLYIGDMVQDVRLAKEHGFMSGVFTKGWQSPERLSAEKPDHIFDSYKDIQRFFEERGF